VIAQQWQYAVELHKATHHGSNQEVGVVDQHGAIAGPLVDALRRFFERRARRQLEELVQLALQADKPIRSTR